MTDFVLKHRKNTGGQLHSLSMILGVHCVCWRYWLWSGVFASGAEQYSAVRAFLARNRGFRRDDGQPALGTLS